jgi:hypothetical protein
MRNSIRWSVIVGALLLAAVVGFESYQAGVEHGIEQSGKIVVASPAAPATGAYPVPYPYPYPYYGWHGPWHFGFGPIILLFFGFAVLRGLFWRRRFLYGGGPGAAFRGFPGGPGGGCDPRSRLDEWHRQAHAQDGGLNSPGATSAP